MLTSKRECARKIMYSVQCAGLGMNSVKTKVCEDSSSKVLIMNVISTPLNVVSAAIFSFR